MPLYSWNRFHLLQVDFGFHSIVGSSCVLSRNPSTHSQWVSCNHNIAMCCWSTVRIYVSCSLNYSFSSFWPVAILIRFTGCKLQQRYVLAVMLFFSLVVSLSLRYNLSIVLTQMVYMPNVSDKSDTVDVSFCPIQNTTNFLGTSLSISANTSKAAEQHLNDTVFVYTFL